MRCRAWVLRAVPAAADVENAAVDEAGLAAGEVADGGCDLVRCGRAPGRGHGCEHVELAAHRFGALGAGRPWADRVDPDAAGAEPGRPGLGGQGECGRAR